MEFGPDQNQVEEEEDDEEEMGVPEPPLVFDSLINSATKASKLGHSPEGSGGGGVSSTIAARKGSGSSSVRYRECLKNHAVRIGGHAVDGCREFLAASEEGKLEALRCAACNCHRNFHRKEADDETTTSFPQHRGQHHHHHQQHYNPHQVHPYYRTPSPATAGYLPQPHQCPHPLTSHHLPNHRPLALPAAVTSGEGHSREEEDMSNPSSSGGGGIGSRTKNKRFRTKFTQEQKDKMQAFADRLGWRMQKHDDATVEQFCAEIGVKRHVLKVWMHNNRNSLNKTRCTSKSSME